MAGVAVGGQPFEHAPYMTGLTVDKAVSSIQRKSRGKVIKIGQVKRFIIT